MSQDPEIHYKVMRILEANAHATQREVARELGVSVGKVNYCVRALIERGFVKARNFKNSNNKVAYAYLMTPRGIREKSRLAIRFLGIKMREYELLRADIERMRADAGRGE